MCLHMRVYIAVACVYNVVHALRIHNTHMRRRGFALLFFSLPKECLIHLYEQIQLSEHISSRRCTQLFGYTVLANPVFGVYSAPMLLSIRVW